MRAVRRPTRTTKHRPDGEERAIVASRSRVRPRGGQPRAAAVPARAVHRPRQLADARRPGGVPVRASGSPRRSWPTIAVTAARTAVAAAHGLEAPDTRSTSSLVGAALALPRSVFGMSTWVAGDAQLRRGAAVHAVPRDRVRGRRDRVRRATLDCTARSSLPVGAVDAARRCGRSDDPRLRAMTYIAAFYLVCMVVHPPVATRSFLEALPTAGPQRATPRTSLEDEQMALTDVERPARPTRTRCSPTSRRTTR